MVLETVILQSKKFNFLFEVVSGILFHMIFPATLLTSLTIQKKI